MSDDALHCSSNELDMHVNIRHQEEHIYTVDGPGTCVNHVVSVFV
jgi:hypothetical protein